MFVLGHLMKIYINLYSGYDYVPKSKYVALFTSDILKLQCSSENSTDALNMKISNEDGVMVELAKSPGYVSTTISSNGTKSNLTVHCENQLGNLIWKWEVEFVGR